MMYLGSQRKVVKQIKDIVLSGWGTEYKTYIEPFVGSGSMLREVPAIAGTEIIGFDKNHYLIAFYNYCKVALLHEDVTHFNRKYMKDDLLEVVISRGDYTYYRDVAKYDEAQRETMGISDEFLGYVGLMYAFNGDFFAGFVDEKTKTANVKSFLSSLPQFINKHFYPHTYEVVRHILPDDKRTIIFCDPPRVHKTNNGRSFRKNWLEIEDRNAMYAEMWDWTAKGNVVYLTDNEAPEPFHKLWTSDNSFGLDNLPTKKVENLYSLLSVWMT